MTVLITEITHFGIVFGADQNHYFVKNGGHLEIAFRAKKIYRIPYLNAGVGYFGMARVGRNNTPHWLPNFTDNNSTCKTIGEFSLNLRDALQKETSKEDRKGPYGFHISGYQGSLPEFWFVRNYDSWNGEDGYKGLSDRFRCDEQFINDPENAHLARSNSVFRMTYQNGSIQLFHLFSQKINSFFQEIPHFRFADVGFKPFRSIDDYAKIPRFKLESLRRLYNEFYHVGRRPMGGKIDLFTIPKPK